MRMRAGRLRPRDARVSGKDKEEKFTLSINKVCYFNLIW
jgi:hypothetical protein